MNEMKRLLCGLCFAAKLALGSGGAATVLAVSNLKYLETDP